MAKLKSQRMSKTQLKIAGERIGFGIVEFFKMNQRQFADLCKIKPNHLSNVVNGSLDGHKRSIPSNIINMIASTWQKQEFSSEQAARDYYLAEDWRDKTGPWEHMHRLGLKAYPMYHNQEVYVLFPDGNYSNRTTTLISIGSYHAVIIDGQAIEIKSCPMCIYRS